MVVNIVFQSGLWSPSPARELRNWESKPFCLHISFWGETGDQFSLGGMHMPWNQKQLLSVLWPLMAIALIVAACGGNDGGSGGEGEETTDPAPTGQSETIYIRWVASSPGATWYPLSAGMGEILENAMPNVRVTVGPGGGKDNPTFVQNGEAQLGWTYGTNSYEAANQLGDYDIPHDKVRHVVTMYAAHLPCAVPANSDIYDFSDVGDRVITFGPATYASNVLGHRIMEMYGWTDETIMQNGGRVEYLEQQAFADLMKDGQGDVLCVLTDPAVAVYRDLDNTLPGGIRFIGIKDDEIWNRFFETYPSYVGLEIPAGYADFKNHTEDIRIPGDVAIIVGSVDVPDEVIYTLLKETFAEANIDKVRGLAGSVKNLSVDMAVQGASIPLHPGARKFYEEIGLDLSNVPE